MMGVAGVDDGEISFLAPPVSNDFNSSVICTSPASAFRSTLRGLTVGSLVVNSDVDKQPCLVFGLSFSGWLPALDQLGFSPIGVILSNASCLSLVNALIPMGCRVIIYDNWQSGD